MPDFHPFDPAPPLPEFYVWLFFSHKDSNTAIHQTQTFDSYRAAHDWMMANAAGLHPTIGHARLVAQVQEFELRHKFQQA